jgi:hypothetical protein
MGLEILPAKEPMLFTAPKKPPLPLLCGTSDACGMSDMAEPWLAPKCASAALLPALMPSWTMLAPGRPSWGAALLPPAGTTVR